MFSLSKVGKLATGLIKSAQHGWRMDVKQE